MLPLLSFVIPECGPSGRHVWNGLKRAAGVTAILKSSFKNGQFDVTRSVSATPPIDNPDQVRIGPPFALLHGLAEFLTLYQSFPA
jgi:hypothetical protein